MATRRISTDGFVDPCIPTLAAKPPSGPGWVHEIKHDGYRLIVRRDGTAVRLFTRRGYDWTDRYPAIAAARGQAAREVVHAGWRGGGGRRRWCCHLRRPASSPQGQRGAPIRVRPFGADGEDLRPRPLSDRKAKLARLLARAPAGIVYNEHTDLDGATVFLHAFKLGLEGIVSKRLTAPYRSGPSRDWIKVKNPDSPAMRRARAGTW
jgi:bifunctional non-homologous end joining protein LigD